jgi:SAM-dependent methyltransferase
MSNLVKLNNLVINENQIYRLPGQEGVNFDYSDGREVEQYLEKVFSGARDLGSRSQELQKKIIDWPSEYHLSSDRSNILRPYDLSFARNVLEFGSGCGAISRYLGEQGVAVDAVEGSEIRASLGKMRCRGLDNVSVINANYHDLNYPKKHYDVILFIGVIEYASKFHPDAESDRDAAIGILNQAKQFLKDDGVIIVAIENRLGLKYILGHHEDHYSKKYVGIHGYHDSAGIATYSDSEWREISREAGLAHCRFSFPFPDYKIPRVTLGEEFAGTTPYAFNHLEGIYSRDYARPVKKSPTEFIAWEAANSGGFLNTIANSFCLALGNDAKRLDQIMDFDFCHTPGPGRKNSFAVVTRKKKGSNIVEKIPIPPLSSEPSTNVTQVLGNQEYLKGNLLSTELSTEWLRSILIYSRREEFDALLGTYYDYLGELEGSGQSLKIDMLPINIIVAEDGRYQLFDQEWEVTEPVCREYLLFRALLTFIVTNWVHMKDFLGWLELHSVRDFVDYGFRNHKLLLAEYLDEFVNRENCFQQATINTDGERGVQQLLDTRFDFSSDDRNIYSTLFWVGTDQEFDISRSLEKSLVPDPELQQIVFRCDALSGPVKSIRIDPFDIRKTDQIGFYRISEIQIVSCSSPVNSADEKVLWRLDGEQNIAENCVAQSAWFEPLADCGFWISSTEFPKMHFELDQAVEAAPGEQLEIRICMGIAESSEYILAHHRYISRLRQMQQTEEDLKKSLHHLKSARKEITDIKAGKPFRLGMKIFSILGFLKK